MMRSCTRTNSSPMMWRFRSGSRDAGERGQELLLRRARRRCPGMRAHEIGFAFAHQAGIDVDAAHAVGAQRARGRA